MKEPPAQCDNFNLITTGTWLSQHKSQTELDQTGRSLQ